MPDLDDQQDPGGPDEAALAIVARHALHDEELVAAFAAGALDGDDETDERTRARALVDRCPACRAVHDDVAAIGASLRGVAAFTAQAPRDFRLTVEDAHRLGGTVLERRVQKGFRALLFAFARPIGASVAALGLVGVLVGGAVLGAGGMATGQATDTAGRNGATASQAAAAAPTTSEVAANSASSPKATELLEFGPAGPGSQDGAPTGWLLIVSIVAVVAGLALFVIGTRAGARRGVGAGTP